MKNQGITYPLFVLIVFTLGCSFQDNRQFIYSPDGLKVITLFEHQEDWKSYTIITNGRYENSELPESYISVRNKWRDGWQGIIDWNYQPRFFYSSYGDFECVNTEASGLACVNVADQKFHDWYKNADGKNRMKISANWIGNR